MVEFGLSVSGSTQPDQDSLPERRSISPAYVRAGVCRRQQAALGFLSHVAKK